MKQKIEFVTGIYSLETLSLRGLLFRPKQSLFYDLRLLRCARNDNLQFFAQKTDFSKKGKKLEQNWASSCYIIDMRSFY
jgi:hypothetical protein